MIKHILIIGFGKMGKLYSKYLTDLGVTWSYYDPFIGGGVGKLVELNNYSHIMICTPPKNHYESYKKVTDMDFEGCIYIDKPIIISEDHMDIFSDERVFAGMTERYNPVVDALKQRLDIDNMTSIKFSRYSTVPENIKTEVFFDLGIHDLDLYLHLLDCDNFPGTYDVFEKSKTCYIMSEHMGILSIFEWSHESHRRERKIVVLQKDIVYEVDLIDQTILMYGAGQVRHNLYVDKGKPLKNILKSFLEGDDCIATLSHEFMFKVIHTKWDKEAV